MTTWINNGDGGLVGVVPCPIHPEHAQAVMRGSIVFKMGEEALPDVRQASICLTIDNLRALGEQVLEVADWLDPDVPDAEMRD